MIFREGKSAASTFGKRLRRLLLKCATVMLVLSLVITYPACSGDFLGLEDYQRDLLFGLGSLALSLLSPAGTVGPAGPAGDPGEPGPAGATEPGPAGLACWDLNGNGEGDPSEDINGDEVFDTLDCQGADGQDGAAGQAGAEVQTGANGTDGAAGAAGATGATGAEGPAGPTLFDTFIDELYTVECGSYGELTNEALDPVGIIEPGLGACVCDDACDAQCTDVVAYKTPIGYRYGGGPVIMSLYFWRAGEKTDGCFALTLDAYQGRHNESIIQYGGQRVILPELVGPLFDGILLVIDLPLNVELLGPEGPGLGFPDDLLTQDLLAFELNAIGGFHDGGCYTLLGAEFVETAEATTAAHARIYSDTIELLNDPDVDCTVLCAEDMDCSGLDNTCNVGVCNQGECEAQPTNQNGECDDGSACTEDDTCTEGACSGTTVDCSEAGDQCNTASCDLQGGEGNCDTMTPVLGLCDDGEACTIDDMCSDGNCVGTAVDCSEAGDQCNTASCDPAGDDGNCDTMTAVENGTPCSDGVDCTVDECVAGVCESTPDSSACSDGVVCTGVETCDPDNADLPGGCKAGTPPVDCCTTNGDCDDMKDCTIDTCTVATGQCLHQDVHSDDDGVPDCIDNCPQLDNPGQEDQDEDGIGDVCDICPAGPNDQDGDGDLIPDGCDNCPEVANAPGHGTCVNGEVGGACVDDADCLEDDSACSNDQEDSDGDGLGDACDACPLSEDVGGTVDLFPQCDKDNLVENIPDETGCTPQDLFNDCVRICACAEMDNPVGQFQSCVAMDCASLLVDLGICGNPGCITNCTAQLQIAPFLDECCEDDANCNDDESCTIDSCGDDGVCDHFPILGCM
ncbi:MAG: hypothetical protein O7D91_10585 [Planctomycetota bacterium]|nr:hypothetical protein [Planctomycetota bacterium]